ncbi:MAG: hypothetical protein ABSA65_17670 [Acidimicrobiales bacterium]|jgi:hypothetical protein
MRLRTVFAFGAIVALVIGVGASVAYGYFTSYGSGTGSGSTGTLRTVTVATVGTPTVPLFPGGTGDVVFSVTNPNDFTVSLVSVSGDGTITADADHSGCTTTGVTLSVPPVDLPISIPAETVQPIDLSGAASMSPSSLSACQGATFSIPITITVDAP